MCLNQRKGSVDGLVRRYVPFNAPRPYWELIRVVRSSSRLLSPCKRRGRADPSNFEDILRACSRLAQCAALWHREPSEWVASESNPWPCLRSLISHLLDQYPVPKFMTPVWWYEADMPWRIALYLHLATGRSPRKFVWPFPVRMTKKITFHFMQAPDDLHPLQAVRWGQVRALGGETTLARVLAREPCLAVPTADEHFWESVLHFLIRHQHISSEEIRAIVTFLHRQKFVRADLVWGPWAGEEPLQPDLTVRGRSLMSLRRLMANWREEVRDRLGLAEPSGRCWKRMGIRPYQEGPEEDQWSIVELLTDKELRAEGGIMRHCVAEYIPDCARGDSSIWSMRIRRGEQTKRVMTIEVIPTEKIVWQAKGKANSAPSETAMELLRRWAERESLTVSDHL